MNCVRLLKQNLFTTQVVELENVYREEGRVRLKEVLSTDLRFVVTSFNTNIKHGAHLEVLFKALLNHGYVYPTHPRVPKWVIEKRLNKNIVHYRDVFAWVYVDSGDMRKKFDSKVIPVEKIIKNALKPQ